MITNIEDVKQINSERLREQSRAKAEKYKAQQDADAVNGWNVFLAKHTGAKAVRDGIVFYDCTANREMVELLLYEEELPLNAESIEWGWSECRNRLAQFPKTTQYEQKVDINESRILPQQRSFAPPDKVAPYLRSELLAMTKSQLRNAIKVFGIRSINAILAQS